MATLPCSVNAYLDGVCIPAVLDPHLDSSFCPSGWYRPHPVHISCRYPDGFMFSSLLSLNGSPSSFWAMIGSMPLLCLVVCCCLMSVFCLSSLLIALEFRDRRPGSDRQSDASCGPSAQSDISSVPPCGADGVTGRNLSDSVSAPSSSSFINEHVPSQSILSVDQLVTVFYNNITRSRGVGLRSSYKEACCLLHTHG